MKYSSAVSAQQNYISGGIVVTAVLNILCIYVARWKYNIWYSYNWND